VVQGGGFVGVIGGGTVPSNSVDGFGLVGETGGGIVPSNSIEAMASIRIAIIVFLLPLIFFVHLAGDHSTIRIR
jgi:hypothetical protein